MKYGEVFKNFDTANTVCVLVKTDDGLRALSQHNFAGGCCGCCKGCDDDDNLEVERVVDLETMEVLFQA